MLAWRMAHQAKLNGIVIAEIGAAEGGGNSFGFLNLGWLDLSGLDLDWIGLDRLCYDLRLRILHWRREASFGLSIAFRDSSSEHLQGADLALTEGIWPS